MANNTLIGALRAEATLESGKFVDGAKKIRQETIKTEATLKRSFTGMATTIKGFGGAIAAGLSIGLLTGLAKKAIDYAGAIGTAAKQIGVTTTALQELRFAATQMGVKQELLDQGLNNLKVTLGKVAAGAAAPTKAFAAIGLSVKDLNNLDPATAFKKVADGLSKIPDPAKRAAVEVALFQEVGSKLDPVLAGGSEALNRLAAAAHETGVVLSDSAIQSADETADKLDQVRQVLAAQIAGTVIENAQAITTLASALATLTSEVIRFMNSNPRLALAMIGATIGGRFGLPGAVAGGLVGLYTGSKVAAGRDEANADLRFRIAETRKAKEELLRQRSLYGGGPGNKTGVAAAEKRLREQTALLIKATAAARAGPKPPAAGDLSQFLAPAPKRTRTPRARAGPKDRSDQYQQEFERDERRAQVDILRAKQSIATDYSERASLAVQILDLEREGYADQLEYEVAQGKLTKAQAGQLLALYDRKDALERQAIIADEQAQVAQDAARLDQVSFDLDRAKLESEAQLAETAKEQRDVQLRLLELSYRQERARLEAIIADEQSSYAAKEEARRRLQGLGETFGNDKQAVINRTRGPMEDWRAQFADINDELEQLQVQGIMGAVDALSALTGGFDDFADAAKNAIGQVLQELIRLQLMKLAVGLIGGATGSSVAAAPTFATGGFTGWGPRKRIAGFVHSREGVLNAPAMKRIGVPALNALNRGAPLSAVSNDNGLTGGAPMSVTNNFTIAGNVSRETQLQIAARVKQSIASASRKGTA